MYILKMIVSPSTLGPLPREYLMLPPEALAHFVTNLNLRGADVEFQTLARVEVEIESLRIKIELCISD